MEMANLLDAELKTLVIRVLRKLIEYGKNIKEEMKVTPSEIKKNPEGTKRKGKEVRIHTNHLECKEEINIQPEQKKEKRILKSEDKLTKLWDISKRANI